MVKVKVGCRRLAAGEPDAAAGVVLAISATKWTAETTGVELRTNRSSWRSPLGAGVGTGDDFGGHRGSVEDELGARGIGEARGVAS